MNTSDPAAVVTSLSAGGARSLSSEVDPRGKSFGQTVAEARRTLFEAARHPQQASTLTPGRRSVFDALKKARKDIDGRARQTPGNPGPARDPAVEPSSYRPASPERGVGPSRFRHRHPARPFTPAEAPRPIEAPRPTNPPKRGLFEMLMRSCDSG